MKTTNKQNVEPVVKNLNLQIGFLESVSDEDNRLDNKKNIIDLWTNSIRLKHYGNNKTTICNPKDKKFYEECQTFGVVYLLIAIIISIAIIIYS